MEEGLDPAHLYAQGEQKFIVCAHVDASASGVSPVAVTAPRKLRAGRAAPANADRVPV
jgi:hypothetical protein